MRKGQEKILEKAEKHHFSQEKKNFLAREDLSIKELNLAYDFLYRYDVPDYKILELIVTNKQCQKHEYALWCAIYHEILPKMEDLYAVLQNSDIPDDKKGIIISMLGNGWKYSDCCQFFAKYQDVIKRAFEKEFGLMQHDTDSNFYKILKMSNDQNGKLSLWKEYLIAALSDEKVTPSNVSFAVDYDIHPTEFKNCDYKINQYLKEHIPGLDILSEKFVNTDIMRLSCKHISNLEKLQEVISVLNNENSFTIQNNPFYTLYISITEKSIIIKLEYFSSTYYSKGDQCWHGSNNKGKLKLVMFHDGGVYYELKTNRLVPLSIKKLLSIKHTYGPYGEKIFQFVMKNSTECLNAPVLKDIYRLIEETDMFLPPVTFNECKNIHNPNELFKKTEREFSVTCIRDESGTDYPSCFL